MLDGIKVLKDKYNEETKAMVYKDKEMVLAREAERLLIKGFEQIWMTTRDRSNLKGRQLEESVKYLEA